MTDLDLGIFTANLDQGKSIYATSEKTSIRYHTYPDVYLNGFLLGLLKANLQRRETTEIPHAPALTRITSYNVCYTKLLRHDVIPANAGIL